MDGKSHLAAGFIFAGVGLMVTQTPLQHAAIPLVIGGLSGIVPDLDHHNGILIKRITVIMHWTINLAILISAVYFASQLNFIEVTTDTMMFLVMAIIASALAVIYFISRLKPKKILLISGVVVTVFGSVISSTALVLLGIYFICASQLKHRGLTHSLHFLVFWSCICYFIEKELQFSMIWLTGTLGYLSHLITDHWFSKKKIKWIKTNEVMRVIAKFKKTA